MKQFMILSNFQYLAENYLTLDQLTEKTGVSESVILEFIQHKLIPQHTHEVKGDIEFSTKVFGKEQFSCDLKFYSPDLAQWILKVQGLSATHSYDQIREILFKEFMEAFKDVAFKVKEARQFYASFFISDTDVDMRKLEETAKEEWEHVLVGVYGTCLKEINATNIVKKEVAVFVLKKFLEQTSVRSDALEEISYFLELYHEVSAEFAPYERSKSTRAQVYDLAREKYDAEAGKENPKMRSFA